MVQQEAELTHRPSGKCLTARTDRFAKGELTSIPEGKSALVPSLLVRENCAMHWTALHLCPNKKASDASALFVGELKIIHIHKQGYRTFVKIIPNAEDLAVS